MMTGGTPIPKYHILQIVILYDIVWCCNGYFTVLDFSLIVWYCTVLDYDQRPGIHHMPPMDSLIFWDPGGHTWCQDRPIICIKISMYVARRSSTSPSTLAKSRFHFVISSDLDGKLRCTPLVNLHSYGKSPSLSLVNQRFLNGPFSIATVSHYRSPCFIGKLGQSTISTGPFSIA